MNAYNIATSEKNYKVPFFCALTFLVVFFAVGCSKRDSSELEASNATRIESDSIQVPDGASKTSRQIVPPFASIQDDFGQRLASSGVAFDLKPTLKNAEIGNSTRLAYPKKKLIEFGWDCPTTDYIRRHWVEMEENAPFDGVVCRLEGTAADGRTLDGTNVFSKERWEASNFKRCVDDLNSCDFKRYFNNFALICFGLDEIDWADDDAWANASEKAAICAQVARQTNGGLCFDLETYNYPLFRYDAEHSYGRTFEEAKKLARRRGAEFGGAIIKEYPNVVILAFWLNSGNIGAGMSANVDQNLLYYGNALLPSFVDGLLDAAAPETTFVDACEEGYYKNGAAEYDQTALEILSASGPCARLVAPENRVKYRTQVQAGFGFYFDIYSNSEGAQYYRSANPGKTRFETLVDNLKAARSASDEYVWCYGESACWFPKDSVDEPESGALFWNDVLPGLRDVVLELTSPVESLKNDFDRLRKAEKEGKIKNEVVNGDFSSFEENDGSPSFEGWGACWFDETNGAKPILIDGAAGIVGSGGYYSQSFAVKPGDTILFAAKVKSIGRVIPKVGGIWYDENEAMEIHDWEPGFSLRGTPDFKPDENGFRTIIGRAVAPKSARSFSLFLETEGAASNDVALFDDVRFYSTIRSTEEKNERLNDAQ